MTEQTLDFRSDTVTKPTEEMLKAMVESPLGDDVFGDDPTVIKLQKRAAEIMGKEAALFVPSGTMGNLIAVGLHTNPGQEVIMEAKSHTFNFEVAGCARFWGIQTRTIMGLRGSMNPEEVKRAIRPDVFHIPSTALVMIENTSNFHGGAVVPLENIKAISEIVREKNLKLHIDGARIMNAAVAAGVKPSEYGRLADSIMFCLSKGLSAPVGSLLVGDADFIEKAKKLRKALGGAMRQAGVIAGAGLVALEEINNEIEGKGPKRLAEDHEKAERLAKGLSEITGIVINVNYVDTNIVLFKLRDGYPDHGTVLEKLKENGLLITSMAGEMLRMVTHRNVSKGDVKSALEIINKTLPELKI